MQASTIPHEIVAQAAMLNRYAGALQAWAYLASHGIAEAQIFELLKMIDVPDRASAP